MEEIKERFSRLKEQKKEIETEMEKRREEEEETLERLERLRNSKKNKTKIKKQISELKEKINKGKERRATKMKSWKADQAKKMKKSKKIKEDWARHFSSEPGWAKFQTDLKVFEEKQKKERMVQEHMLGLAYEQHCDEYFQLQREEAELKETQIEYIKSLIAREKTKISIEWLPAPMKCSGCGEVMGVAIRFKCLSFNLYYHLDRTCNSFSMILKAFITDIGSIEEIEGFHKLTQAFFFVF